MLFFITFLPVRVAHCDIIPNFVPLNFLNAIMRFIAHNKKPIMIISDNVTNFVEAENRLD